MLAKNAPRSYPEKIAGVQGSSLDSETGKRRAGSSQPRRARSQSPSFAKPFTPNK